MSSLRALVIKLAYTRPDLRSKLLPLVAKEAMSVGKTVENEKSMLRIHRFMHSLRVTDLTNAGKRGKRVDEFALYDLDYVRDPDAQRALEKVIGNIGKARNYKDALSKAKKYVEGLEPGGVLPKIEEMTYKGVEVTPAGFKPIKIDGKYISIEAGYRDFVVRDKEDRANYPVCMARGKKGIKLFYRWVQDNLSKLPNMRFNQLTKAIGAAGIDFHEYCSMD